MKILLRFVDNGRENSLATRLRQKRVEFFASLVSQLPRPLRILDVGGSDSFWDQTGFLNQKGVQIVLLNLMKIEARYPNLRSVVGDARDLREFRDKQFDVVFSNSVIEHVGNGQEQRRMAEEVRRVGKRYFVQTPNRYFPIEPHFLIPWFQFLPLTVKVFLIRDFNLGWYPKTRDRQKALARVTSINLLSRRELKALFPTARVYQEKFFGLTKSFVAYEGFDGSQVVG